MSKLGKSRKCRQEKKGKRPPRVSGFKGTALGGETQAGKQDSPGLAQTMAVPAVDGPGLTPLLPECQVATLTLAVEGIFDVHAVRPR